MLLGRLCVAFFDMGLNFFPPPCNWDKVSSLSKTRAGLSRLHGLHKAESTTPTETAP